MNYDTIIVGAGAAGASAAIYATRYNLKTLMLGGPMPGGLITEASEVENYPGYLSISGLDLAKKFIDQAVALGADYKIEIVKDIEVKSENGQNKFKVITSMGEHTSSSVIIAMGTYHRKLGAKGEQEFAGRGVSYCATCDAPFFKKKIVAVVGGGNSAVEAAQDLSVHAEKVYIIYRSELKAAPIYIEQLRKRTNVIEIADTNVVEITGEKFVQKIILDKEFNGSTSLDVNGLFVQIGYLPNNELSKKLGLDLTTYGYVSVDAGMGTSLPGIFCAGDLNNSSNMLHQQVTSAAEGAIAAQSAYRHIHGLTYLVNG